MEKMKFGELEFAILQIVEELGRATVHDVGKRLEREYTTIMTVMSRLFEKKELLREKAGKQYVYWRAPAKSVFQRIQDKLFGSKPAAIVSYLIDSDEISDENWMRSKN